MTTPAEHTQVHTRLLKCTLEPDDARAYWQRTTAGRPVDPRVAFDEYWFGARSLPRVEVLLTNFRARFDAYPAALAVLHAWTDMDPDVRRQICHWHLQLSDPLYRSFTGEALPARRAGPRPDISHPLAVAWVGEHGPARWTMSTRIQFASKLLSSALAAGLVATNRDPRALLWPRIGDHALTYLMYLLRDLRFAGSLLQNPYLASVGLAGHELDVRLRGLAALAFRRQGDLVDFGWKYPDLATWAAATIHAGVAA